MSKKNQAFKLFAEGKKPGSPEVKSLGLASKTRYNYFQEWKKPGAPVKTKAQEIEQSQVSISSLPVTDDIDKAQFIKFNPYVFNCRYTRIMHIARLVTIKEWGWPEDLPFEDFIDIILYHFFKDRGITLQEYIVEGKHGNEEED